MALVVYRCISYTLVCIGEYVALDTFVDKYLNNGARAGYAEYIYYSDTWALLNGNILLKYINECHRF